MMSSRPGPLDTIVIGYPISCSTNSMYFLQFSGKEYTEKEILKKVKDVWTKDLKNKVGDMKDVKIYLKPEESAAYYVVNGDTTGKIDL